jgi:hypothetical protein
MKRRRWVVAGAVLVLGLSVFAVAGVAAGRDPWRLLGRHMTALSPAEIGQAALDYTQAAGYVHNGPTQVLLARAIKNEELPALGLGCPLEFGTIEEPPLALAIVNGDLAPRLPGLTMGAPRPVHYIGYVFDLWAGVPTLTITSATDAVFRTALHDPGLPVEATTTPLTCPTPLPYPKTLHYGDTAPTAPPARP